MKSEDLLNRLKQFAFRIVSVTKSLPETSEAKIIKNQILRHVFLQLPIIGQPAKLIRKNHLVQNLEFHLKN